jgi:DNA polymerase zeta
VNPDLGALFKNMDNLEKMLPFITISPNRVAYVKKNIREGVIPRVLQEFLNSRIMIKRSMKHVSLKQFIHLP